jgi:hypothetical protein
MSDALEAADAYLAFLSGYRYSEADGPVDIAALSWGAAGAPPVVTTPDQATLLYRHLAEGLVRVPDPYAAAVLAVHLGSMVERGEDPAALGEAMVARLSLDLAAARRFVEVLESEHEIARPDGAGKEALVEVARREPAGAAAWAGLQLSTMGAMAAWCRHAPSRRRAARVPGLAAAAAFLGQRGGYSYFIGELLQAADGVELLVLAPAQRKGFVVELMCVRNAAHLFALLEDALIGDPAEGLLSGPRVDPEIAAIARGEQMLTSERTFSIGWHYEYWFGVRPAAGARLTGLHSLIAAMIGVEASVSDLPAVRGQPIVLMKPAMLGSRMCEAGGFFAPLHDALRSQAAIRRRLSGDEVDAWMRDLDAEADRLDRSSN